MNIQCELLDKQNPRERPTRTEQRICLFRLVLYKTCFLLMYKIKFLWLNFYDFFLKL